MNMFGKIAFIGAGNMAEAMIKGILSSGMAEPTNIYVTNKNNTQRLEKLNKKWGVIVSQNKKVVLQNAKIVVLVVKPQDMEQTLTEIKDLLTKDQLIISTAAGLSLDWFEKRLGTGYSLVRTMTNLPCQVKEGATAVTMGKNTGNSQRFIIDALFSSLGIVVHVKEDKIDTITGLSGS